MARQRARSKQVEPSLSPRETVEAEKCSPCSMFLLSFIRSICARRRRNAVSFHKLSFLPPFILGNFGLTTTHNNIFFDRRHRAILSLSSPFPSPPILFPSTVVTCNKWLDSPPPSPTRWKSASHPDRHRRPRPHPPLLRSGRKGAKVPSIGYSECGWDHWDSGSGGGHETFFQASIHSARPLPCVGANYGP